MKAATRERTAAARSASDDAVADACREVVDALGGEVGLLLAFASGELDFARSAAAMQSLAGDGVATAGMTGKGLITADGPLDEGCVAVAFGPQLSAGVAVADRASEDLRAAGRSSTREALGAVGASADLVLLFIDTTKGDIADTVSGAYEAAGPGIPLAGGAASGGTKSFFHMGSASADSVVAVALASEDAVAIGSTQSYAIRGTPSIVTRSEGQRIEEIDGRPAEEVYLEQLGLASASFGDEEFEALAITHPLAQPELHGDVRLRHVLGRGGDGAIVLGTHIPAGAAIEFTELDVRAAARQRRKVRAPTRLRASAGPPRAPPSSSTAPAAAAPCATASTGGRRDRGGARRAAAAARRPLHERGGRAPAGRQGRSQPCRRHGRVRLSTPLPGAPPTT